MNSERDGIILDESNDRPAAKVGMVVVALTAVLAAWGFLGLVGSPVEVPAQDLPNVTSPTQQPLAVMPDLEGLDLIAVRNRLRAAGLDLEIVSLVRWIANPDVPRGLLASQSPPAGTELFDPNDLLLVMSAGGPAVTWDDVPLNLQELAAENYLVDRTEPVLELNMQAGLVYKTDALLLGDCFAVDQARNTFYDGSFASLCDVGEPEVVVSWLADGSMFVVEGLPPQGIHPSIGTEIVWTDEPRLAGPQYWTPSERLEPSVVVDGDAILVTGGYHQFNLIPALDGAMAEQIAALIEPLDIRGSLVIQLTPPLGFSSRGYWGARGLQGTTFAAFKWFDAVSTTNGIEYSWNPLIENKAITTSVAATTWKVIRNATWQYALPAGWVTPSSNSPDGDSPLVAATFEDTSTGKWCEVYPVGSLSQIGPTDAFVGVYYASSTDSNLWLDHFGPDDIRQVSVSDPVPECLEGTDAEVRTSSRFYDGTALDIMIGFGADVTPETRKQAFAILDSFETLPVYGDP